ncbi:MAG TPA: hypothetical protein VHE61_14925 [Opitutaceae bacterium]|nr:hypothetical protein [Opitutaceae bacterium]
MKFLRMHTSPFLVPCAWQRQPHDHVLRENEREHGAFGAVCQYVFANPVRRQLENRPGTWPYSGTVVPGLPTLDLRDATKWAIFWDEYNRRIARGADEVSYANGPKSHDFGYD